jgi:hypothetical protein
LASTQKSAMLQYVYRQVMANTRQENLTPPLRLTAGTSMR